MGGSVNSMIAMKENRTMRTKWILGLKNTMGTRWAHLATQLMMDIVGMGASGLLCSAKVAPC